MSEEEVFTSLGAFLGLGGLVVIIIISVIYALAPIIMMCQLWRINANIKKLRK